MFTIRFIALLSAAAAAVSAAPLVDRHFPTNTTDVDRDLRNGEMLVFGEGGRSQIITEATWNRLLKRLDIAPEAPEIDHDWLKAADHRSEHPVNTTHFGLGKRDDCDSNYQTVVDRTERFVDWDVQMSPVVIGAGDTGIDISISKSYTVSNSVTVSAGVDLGLVTDRLEASLGVDFSRSWTTAQGVIIRGTVGEGETGVVITRPWTNRRYGRTFQGCVGALSETGTFVADSREEGSYEGVTWVAGAITACIKKQSSIPLSLCNGSGNFK